MTHSVEEFVSERLVPAPLTGDARAMARGEPGLPRRFTWRDEQYSVAGVVETWKTSGPCRHGGGEMYLRRHWYKIVTEPRLVMTVYCERQARSSKQAKARWWIYTVERTDADESGGSPRGAP